MLCFISADIIHTISASGWYIFIETSYPRVPNDTARIMSSNIPSTNGKCLQFWYHMYGDHVDNLTVYMKTGSMMTPLWKKSGTQGNRWRHGVLNIVSRSRFQVIWFFNVPCTLTPLFSGSLTIVNLFQLQVLGQHQYVA